MRSLILFLKDIFRQRKMLKSLAKNDFKQQYLGSALGILWAFIQPTIMICLYWFVFSVGFKSQPVENVPFICWLVAGLIPYFFFADAWGKCTNVVIEYSYLVKKIVFSVRLLPIIKIISSCYIHLFFIVFTIALFAVYGFYPDLYYLQLIYYVFALWILLLGLGWLTAAMQVFLKDVTQIVSVICQILFWGTPILYATNIVPEKVLFILKTNPLYYIVQGYRDIFISKQWFWQHPVLTVYFWVVTLCIFILGAFVFRQLRPHFADVL